MKRKYTNEAGIALIKSYETLRLQSYLDRPGGVWTIGWGTTGKDIVEGLTWTEEQCEARFRSDLAWFERGVSGLVMLLNISDNSFSALVSLAYNIGLDQFSHSTLLRKLNNGFIQEAAAEFKRWNKDNGKVLRGLTRRRASERDLFLA